jgi:hypothetical protein
LGYSKKELKNIILNNGTNWVQESDRNTVNFPEGSTILYCYIFDARFEDVSKKERILTLQDNKNVRNVVMCKFRTGNEYSYDDRDSLSCEIEGNPGSNNRSIKVIPFRVNRCNTHDKYMELSQNCKKLDREVKRNLTKEYNESLDDLEQVIECKIGSGL